MSYRTLERRMSLAMFVVDSALAAWVVKTAWSAVRTGPRRTAVRMVLTAGATTGVAIWRAVEHRRLLEEHRLDMLLEEPFLGDACDCDEDDEGGWVFDDEHFSGADIDAIIDSQHLPPVIDFSRHQAKLMSTFSPYQDLDDREYGIHFDEDDE